jgi:hypothetical protein
LRLTTSKINDAKKLIKILESVGEITNKRIDKSKTKGK